MAEPRPDAAAFVRACLHDLVAQLHRHGYAIPELLTEACSDGSIEVYLSLMPRRRPDEPPAPDSLPTATPDDLPPLWADILEAAADKHLTARQLADAAGYRLNSHFRGVLARMRRAGLLHHDDAGYFRPDG